MSREKIYHESSECSKAGEVTLTLGGIHLETRSVQRQRRMSRADENVSSLGRHTCSCVCA